LDLRSFFKALSRKNIKSRYLRKACFIMFSGSLKFKEGLFQVILSNSLEKPISIKPSPNKKSKTQPG
jgi:hypothetical protein